MIKKFLTAAAVLGGILLFPDTAEAQQRVESLTQEGDQAVACVKQGNRSNCDTLQLVPFDTVVQFDTVPDPATEAALTECQNVLGICSANLADALRALDSLSNLPPLPPDTVWMPPDTVALPPDTVQLPPDTVQLPPDTVQLPPDTVSLPPDTVQLPPDTVTLPPDTVSLPPDTVVMPPDTVVIPPDTVIVPCDCDTIPAPPDTIPPPPADSLLVAVKVSLNPDRSSAVPLGGQTLSGDAYVFLETTGSVVIDSVIFLLDGAFSKKESVAPYDFKAGADAAANPWNTTLEANGSHSITGMAYFGDQSVLDLTNFEIDNVPPVPPDTTTPPPPDTTGVAGWPLGTHPHAGFGITIYGDTLRTRVDWAVSYHPQTSATPTGFLVTWPGGSQQTDMGWTDLPVVLWYDSYGTGQPPPSGFLAVTDTICVAPGAVGGPYDPSNAVCASRRDMRY